MNMTMNMNKEKSDQSIELSSIDNGDVNIDENKFHDNSSNQNSHDETLRSSLMLRKKKRRITRIEKLFFHLPKH